MMSQKHAKDSERQFVNIMNEGGFFAQRIAGSGCGKHSVCDVITVMDTEVFLTEVKGTAKEAFVLDAKTKKQLAKLIDKAKSNPPLRPMLAIHWKKRGWQVKNLDIEDVLSSSKIQYDEKNLHWRFGR